MSHCHCTKWCATAKAQHWWHVFSATCVTVRVGRGTTFGGKMSAAFAAAAADFCGWAPQKIRGKFLFTGEPISVLAKASFTSARGESLVEAFFFFDKAALAVVVVPMVTLCWLCMEGKQGSVSALDQVSSNSKSPYTIVRPAIAIHLGLGCKMTSSTNVPKSTWR